MSERKKYIKDFFNSPKLNRNNWLRKGKTFHDEDSRFLKEIIPMCFLSFQLFISLEFGVSCDSRPTTFHIIYTMEATARTHMDICTWYEARQGTRAARSFASRGLRGTLGACTIDVACACACITSHHPPVPNRARTMPPLRAKSSLGVPRPDSDGRRADEHLRAIEDGCEQAFGASTPAPPDGMRRPCGPLLSWAAPGR